MNSLEIFEPEKTQPMLREKTYDDQNRGDLEEWDSSRDGSHPTTPMTNTGKRKTDDDRQPESPPELERQNAPSNWHREKNFRSHMEPMDTDSPASYPKHVMVPSREHRAYREGHSYYEESPSKGSVSTPSLSNENNGVYAGYEHPSYRPSTHFQGQDGGHYHNHSTPPRQSRGQFLPEVEGGSMHYGTPTQHTPTQQGSMHYGTPTQHTPTQQDGYIRPRRWACDYCNVASFVSFEEACSHEDACSRQYHERYGGRPHPSRGPVPQYDQRGGLGALYHASQEVTQPPYRQQQMWGSRGPPIPHLPHEHLHQPHYQQQGHGYQSPPRHPGYNGGYHGREGGHPCHDYGSNSNSKRMLLAMPSDSDSLSDRQCYVRSEMVEIFAATEKDVSARHSKGAQKLVAGQVGIRCIHCAHLRPRDRAERAVCYPSSISRIYQTVADMQRFHFEQCREIPNETRKIYKTLKTTRPRGVGSPQTYWIQSSRVLDLADTDNGIRFASAEEKAEISA